MHQMLSIRSFTDVKNMTIACVSDKQASDDVQSAAVVKPFECKLVGRKLGGSSS